MRHGNSMLGGTTRAPLVNIKLQLPTAAFSGIHSKLVRLIQLTIFMTLVGVAFAGSKVAPDLQANSSSTVDVIVQFVKPPTKQQLKLLGSYGRMKHIFEGIKAAHLTLPVSAIQALANNPSILYLSPDRNMDGSLDLADQATNAATWQQYGLAGTGIGVAIIDSGVSLKNDLKTADTLGSRIVDNESFEGDRNPSELYGQGTHLAGIVAGNSADSTGQNFARTFKGIAPNANIINLDVLDQMGSGTESGVIAAIQRAIQLHRNTLEWRCGPASQWPHPTITSRAQHLILICQQGFQSSLAAATLQRLGLTHATDLDGGLDAWAA